MELQLTSFETAIKNFLDNLAKEDDAFAKNYAKENKSISECCKYIMQEVEKNKKKGERCVACSDEEVFGLAIHYYDEDDIVVSGPKAKVETVQTSAPTDKLETKPKKRRTSKAKSKAQEVDPDIPEPLEIPIF